MASLPSRATTALLLATLACAALACRTPLPPAAQPYTLTPDADFRSQPPPPWEEQETLADVAIEELALANGLKVYIAEEPEVPLVTVAYVNRAGELEAGTPSGLATLTARSILLDTFLPDGTLVSDIQIGGVRPYALVGYGGTSIGFTIVNSGTRVAIETLASIVQRPAFDAAGMTGVGAAIVYERFDDATNLVGMSNVLTSRAILGDDHPWSMEPEKQIRALVELKRSDVLGFYARRYRPDQSAVIIVGDVSRDEILPILERSFGSWQPADGMAPAPAQTVAASSVEEVRAPAALNTGQRRVFALRAGGELAYVVLPQPSVPLGHPDSVPLELVSHVLAGGFTSRANQSLRHEAGMSYGVSVDRVGSGADAYMCIRTLVPQPQLREGVRKMDAVLQRLRTEPVSEAELADARTAYLSSLSGLRGTHGGATQLVATLFFNGLSPSDLRKLEEQVRAATPADLQRAAARYLLPNANLVVLTDWFEYGNQLPGIGRFELFEAKRRR